MEEVEEAKGAEQTERIVLERVVLDKADGTSRYAWEEVGTASGTKQQAIREVVGDRVGVFRAPSLRSWRGAIEQVETERPVQSRLLEE